MRLIYLFIGLLPSFALGSAFTQLPKAFSVPDKRECSERLGVCEIRNMPRVASQDGLGICYACVAATMMQTENCRKLNIDCSNLEKSQLISQLDLTRIVAPQDPGRQAPMARSAYKGLKTSPDDNVKESGGDPHSTALIASLVTKKVASEACVSLDVILSKMYDRKETIEAQEAMWDRMKSYYDDYRKNKECIACTNKAYATAIEEIDKNLDLKVSKEEVLRAFGQDTYEKFLDELTGANKCSAANMVAFESVKTVKYEQFPDASENNPKKLKNPVTDEEFIKKMRDIVRSGRPAALSGVCLVGDPENCKGKNHAVVIAGHRKVCDREPSDPKAVCKDSVKVVNCWGQTWQNDNNDGWVDAAALMKQTAKKPNILGWFEDKK
ncbi:MAG: hypothetical protein HUU57_04930 [Bdellovibrio sp.]|nr:hypothetical protein [Bdellovibrio sp.]